MLLNSNINYLFILSDNWNKILKSKQHTSECDGSTISDITDADFYCNLFKESSFLNLQNSNVTAIFNTDGVSLYSSSKIELWPIFLAINELPPTRRFSRVNMILAGIWQGKGKPPFYQYMSKFSEQMNKLYDVGVVVELPQPMIVKLGVICGTLDLPAKAEVLNMTYFNGAEGCNLCEEPGKTVKQGKGHSRCYPYRQSGDRYPLRTKEGIKRSMDTSTKKKRKKGFCGKSGIEDLTSLDLSKGILPDYMHGILLGVTKTLMYKWFSPTNSGKDYFIGKELKTISKRLMSIKPPDFLERLPRDIEKHYSNLKATEYQTWLLYYCLPCLSDILPEKYLTHLALLAEATHILLQDCITHNDLGRARALLEKFYCDFSYLYGEGSCGLNMHNIGAHLTDCVQSFGPLWAWSCFGFEDSNSMILHAVHGTGNVAKQVLRYRSVLSLLRASSLQHIAVANNKQWRKKLYIDGCIIPETPQSLPNDKDAPFIMQKVGASNIEQVQQLRRVQLADHKLYSKLYTRMKKKIGYVVLIKTGKIVLIRFFVLNTCNNKVYAIVKILHERSASPLSNMEAGKHLQCVCESDDVDVISIHEIQEKLFFIQTDKESWDYVARNPNLHGHAVFK